MTLSLVTLKLILITLAISSVVIVVLNFGAIGHDGNFWSSTENDASNSWLVYFNNSAIAGKSDQSKKWGLSVRCLRD